jgi:signal transduction histidine kinase
MLRTITRSIRHKLALTVLATTIAALVVAGVALVIYDLRAYRQAGIDDLVTQAEILGRASAPALSFDDSKAASENLRLLRAKPGITSAAIYSANGRLFASYARPDLKPVFPRLPESEGSRIEGSRFIASRRIVENSEILGTVYMEADYQPRGRIADYVGIFGTVMVAGLLVALAISAWLQGAITRPILDMAAVTRRVMESRDFSLRMEKTTEDEIGLLAESFNDMLVELGRRAEALEATHQSLAREVKERQRADEDLRELNLELETRVAERTTQLEAANRELESFSYSVSHDLRAPLRAVVGFSQMLVEDHAEQLDEEARRKLLVIQTEAQRMGALIDELLAFSRLGRKAMQLVDVDMTELARSTYESLNGQEAGPKIGLRLAALPRAKGDRALLGQVWANLISNAIKFSSRREQPQVEISAISDEKEHVYFVRDNGAGFDPRYQSKLFGVFQRLHDSSEFPGTGVGLALVQRIVVRHGGRVWAEGRPGEGATFYFTLLREPAHGAL